MNVLSVEEKNRYEVSLHGNNRLTGKKMIHACVTDGCMRRMHCPVCKWRVFDVSRSMDLGVGIIAKCPQCHRVIRIEIGDIAQ